IVAIALFCRPINYNWNKLIGGKCGNTTALEDFSAAFTMMLDIWAVYLPLPTLWGLQMPKQKKIGITATFASGLAIAGINLGRLIQTILCDNTADFSYCLLPSAMLCVGEMSMGVVTCCVPTLGPVFFPARFGPGPGHRWRQNYPESSRSPFPYSLSRSRGKSSSTTSNKEHRFATLTDDRIELTSTAKAENTYQASISQGNDTDVAHAVDTRD
ncbi:hypothetical protein EV356DRAFT_451259, partial [Viridothelium virens]